MQNSRIHDFPQKKCGGKNCYESEMEAKQTANYQESQTEELKLNVYRCSDCKQWHLTRRTKPRSYSEAIKRFATKKGRLHGRKRRV